MTIPLKSLPSEREVVGEVSVCWPWGILCQLFEILSDLHEAETKGHYLYRDSCFLTSLQSRAMHSELNYLEQTKWEIQGERRKKKNIQAVAHTSCTVRVLNQAGGDWVPLGWSGEDVAWHTAPGSKPEPQVWGAQPLWLPLVPDIVM